MARLLPGLLSLCLGGLAAGQGLGWDVPHRGALVYARQTARFAVEPPAARLRPEWLVAGAADGGHEFRYWAGPQDRRPADAEQPHCDDAAWATGRGEFGTEVGKLAGQRTEWRSQLLVVRTRLDLGQRKPKALWFTIAHDDGVRVWLNGKPLLADDGHGRGRQFVVSGAALDAWQRGENLLAAQCLNTGGAQHFDLAVAALQTLPPGVRNGDELLARLREEREQADRVRRELCGPYRCPPLLLQGELAATADHVPLGPGDLRDFGFWAAADLRCGPLGGPVQLEAKRQFRLGDVQLRGRASAVDATGWQTLDLTIKSTAEPAAGEDSNRFVDRFVRPHVWYGIDGKLVVRRRLEVKDGKARVAECAIDLQGRLLRGKDWKEVAAHVQQQETWRLLQVRDGQDAAFRAQVQQALQKGTARLKEQLRDLAQPDLRAEADGADRTYHTGRLALGLLALVKGGVPKDDEVVQRGYAELRRRKLVDTYSLGNAIMAIEALYANPGEFGDLRQGAIDRPRRRQPSPADLELLRQWTAQLLQNVDTRVDPAYLLRFNYVREGRFDNSVNQYGLLGLYSAHLCGVEIPAITWEAAANHLLAAQGPPGAKVELDLVDYRRFAQQLADPEAKRTTAATFARAAGWSYHEPKDSGELTPVWGAMTCAGITGLAICQAALQDHPQLKRHKLQGDANRARNDGFAWLARHLTVRHHPGAIERQQLWFYYYLYGLERAALLSGIALLQDRDWYFEGAMVLVLAQQDNGDWPGETVMFGDDRILDRNAMAILFLKQSTLPVLTGQ